MVQKNGILDQALVEQILTKLGFSAPPLTNYGGLASLYGAWCHRIPFDNIRKRIHLASGTPLPLPGHDDTDFFRGWLQLGVGGTCWAGNAALYALLDALGFACSLATATMMISSSQPPNHGTVSVQCEEGLFLVDASMLYTSPLPLIPNRSSAIEHPAWGLTCSPNKSHWMLNWRPLHMLDGCNCQIEDFSASRDTFQQNNEMSRTSGPFNHALYIRFNDQEEVVGISDGKAIQITSTGEVIQTPLSQESRDTLLMEKVGISEEIIAKIPADILPHDSR